MRDWQGGDAIWVCADKTGGEGKHEDPSKYCEDEDWQMGQQLMLRRTKETSQYGRSTSNYGTCKERLMRYMIIMHMSPYDTYGSM